MTKNELVRQLAPHADIVIPVLANTADFEQRRRGLPAVPMVKYDAMRELVELTTWLIRYAGYKADDIWEEIQDHLPVSNQVETDTGTVESRQHTALYRSHTENLLAQRGQQIQDARAQTKQAAGGYSKPSRPAVPPPLAWLELEPTDAAANRSRDR